MKVLLDTHTFLWWDNEPSKLSAPAFAVIQDPANVILLSVVSVWEILIKTQLGKLRCTPPLAAVVSHQQANGLTTLSVTLDHVLALETLPQVHKDPFDRLLVAQATIEGAVLLSKDTIFGQYPVQVVW